MFKKNIKKEKRFSKSKISEKRKFRLFLNKFFMLIKILSIIILFLLISFKIYKNGKEIFLTDIREYISDLLGYNLEKVYIEGQKNLHKNYIVESLNADVGTALLSIDLEKISQRLKKNSWVKSVSIRRELPNKIYIKIIEKIPIALWQKNNLLYVIDQDGFIVKDAKADDFSYLLHVVGKDANVNAQFLIDEISTNKELSSKITSAVRFGERRWDLNLEEDILVKMPQISFSKAWSYLIDLHNKNKLFGQKIKIIDLRNSSKYYIERH